ncbi:MMPL family transporter [Herbiconiux sp. SYSU D00978]|uniref:MMPL family transporter n=1 Tax=Herbiconiux sp. SYSU D00978 TaxID=2812562 RepID=UPI001A96ADEF|nr:MMPL family transporter [Herbiconiux sp. SYSU D00978]
MRAIERITGRVGAWVVLMLSLVVTGALFVLLPSAEGDEFPQTGLPASAESARVDALLDEFPSADASVGVLVYSREDGGELSDDELTAVGERARALAGESIAPPAVVPQPSEDGTAALVVVPLDADAEIDVTAETLRELASDDLPSGLDARLTGALGFQDDIANAFAGADVRLLLVTVIVVAVLLIVTYRSPVLWIVPLAVVGTADALAGRVAALVAESVGVTLDASVRGILSVLVFGAGTNYALLLVARYREELLHTGDRHAAMAKALRNAGVAILASGGTVVLSLATLLFASLAGNRALGLACVIGILIAMAFALVTLPAALVVCGRGVFWPFVPRVGSAPSKPSLWARLGRGVVRRPVAVLVAGVVGLGALAAGLTTYSVGLAQTDQFLGDPESVQAQEIIDESFGAGLTATTIVLTPDAAVQDALAVAEDTEGVESVRPGESAGGLTRLDVTLDAEPASDDAFAAVQTLRNAYGAESGELGETVVGGSDATDYDVQQASERDLALIAPLILGIVLVILFALLRSVLAPVLLVLTVVATFLASLGVSSLVFTTLLGFPALDTTVTLFAFLFLVALGIDYNIFLTTRAREELATHSPTDALVRALASTGGVITSAGILLAAVFAVLGVLPVVALAQIGTIVCIGVLLDTLVVRTLIVPALAALTGRAFWWPTRSHEQVPGVPEQERDPALR